MKKASINQSNYRQLSPVQAGAQTTWLVRVLIVTVLVGCLAGIILISKFSLIHQSLRLDEAQNLWQSSHTIPGLLKVVAQDVHVPLYHLLQHFWQMYFGHGVVTVRILSLIFFLISVPMMYLLARQILNVGWALFATVLFSSSPFMNWYGNEARMYSLLALMAILSQYFFIRILKGKKGWLGYGITALIGAYTHYFFAFNLATEGLFYIFYRKKFARGSFKKLVAIAILVTLELAPWLWYFHSLGSASNTRPSLPRPSSVDFFNVYAQFLFGFQTNKINTILVSAWPLIVLAGFFAVKRGQQISKEVSFMLTMAFVPIIVAFGLSFIMSPFFLSRYMISSLPPLIIVIVWLVSHYARKFYLVLSAAIIAIIIVTSYFQISSINTPVKENYRGVASLIAQQASPEDAVVLSAPFTVYPFEYYYQGSSTIYTLPNWNRSNVGAIPTFNPHTLPSQVNQIRSNHQKIFLVLSYNQGYENKIKMYFDDHFARTETEHFSPDLNLYVYRVNYNQVPSIKYLAANPQFH